MWLREFIKKNAFVIMLTIGLVGLGCLVGSVITMYEVPAQDIWQWFPLMIVGCFLIILFLIFVIRESKNAAI